MQRGLALHVVHGERKVLLVGVDRLVLSTVVLKKSAYLGDSTDDE